MKGVNSMKYEKPKLDVLTLEIADIIKTSNVEVGDDADQIIPMSGYNWVK